MRHQVSGRKLGRTTSHRIAMLRNLSASLFRHERITTTVQKAKELRPFAEKLITLAKRETLHARRQVLRHIKDREVVKKLFETIGVRYATRPGGYTRIIRTEFRRGDNAEMAIIELVGTTKAAPKPKKKAAPAAKKPQKAPKPAEAESAEEVVEEAAAEAAETVEEAGAEAEQAAAEMEVTPETEGEEKAETAADAAVESPEPEAEPAEVKAEAEPAEVKAEAEPAEAKADTAEESTAEEKPEEKPEEEEKKE